MKRVHEVDCVLAIWGINSIRVIESVWEDEDDTIEVTDKVYVQVSNALLKIYTKVGEEKFLVDNVDEKELILRIKEAVRTAA